MKKVAVAIRDFRVLMAAIAVFSLFGAMLQLTIPLYMLQIYDRVLPSKSIDTLIFLSILAAFALVTLGLTEMVRQILGTRAAARLDNTLATDVMARVIREGIRTNGSAQPLRDLQSVRSLVASKALFGLVDIPFAALFILCLYFIHPNLFWLTLFGAGLLLLIAMVNLSLTAKAASDQATANAAAHQQSEFYARNSDSILAMGMVQNVVANWLRWNRAALAAADRAAGRNAFFSGLSRTVRFGIQAAMLGLGAWLVQQDQMTAGMIFAASIISGRALQPIDSVINAWPQLAAGRHAWMKLKAFLEHTERRTDYTALAAPKGELEAELISQPGPLGAASPPVLSRVSFKLEAGKSVAVIGPSGSGKSTLARILVGALIPQSGEVRLDGHNIENWDPEELGKHVGYLAQDVELLPGTIAQNISRFMPDAKDADVRKAAAMAHVDDLIKRMPQGYDTVIGPGGVSVSGGEKQRIGLARAFFGEPKLIVLDEPNSSLDRLGEQALARALEVAKCKGITVFLVTQRESVVQIVDKIMRINHGKIVDYGNRDVIIRKTAERLHDLKRRLREGEEAVSRTGQIDREAV